MIDQINETYANAFITDYVIMPNHVHLIIELYEKNTIGLSGYIGLLKRLCNKEFGDNVWQKSFYDHVITDEEDYYYHRQYINENPKKWIIGKDKYYS